jgi:HEAT repeat protein
MTPLSPLPRTLGAALRDAGHAKLMVRMSALRDLGRLATGPDRDRALGALVRALREDEAPAARGEAAVALADAQASECIEVLTLASRDEHDHVRQMALLALGEVAPPRDRQAIQAVERALHDRAGPIRFQALIAYGRLSSESAEPEIVAATKDEDSKVRYIALRLLEERCFESERDSRAVPLDGEAPALLLELARGMLTDPAAEVQLAAAILLARAGDDAGHAVLVRAVNEGYGAREPEDEYAALEFAGNLPLSAARRGLERRAWGGLLRKDRFAWQARTALAKMGDRRAISSILRDLSAWTRDTRTLAVAAAGSARLAEARSLIDAMRGDDRRADPHAVSEALAALDACAAEQ